MDVQHMFTMEAKGDESQSSTHGFELCASEAHSNAARDVCRLAAIDCSPIRRMRRVLVVLRSAAVARRLGRRMQTH